MGLDEEDEEFNYGSEFDKYVAPQKKVYKLSSSVPENLTASFQNLLNKRINDNYKVKKRQNLRECFTILKFTIIFIIFITTCKIITLFFGIQDRVEKQYNKSAHETVKICFYLIFSIALIVQFIETYAIIFDYLWLTLVFTSLEFVIIIWAILDNYHSEDEHWLIFLWISGLLILIIHLAILYKMKFGETNKPKQSKQNSIKEKEMNSESSDHLYVPQEDCSYRNFLKQQQSYNQSSSDPYNQQYAQSNYAQSDYVQSTFVQPDYSEPDQSNMDMPNIGAISKSICGKNDSTVDVNLVKFVNDEEEAHEKREQLCKQLLRQCQMTIYHLELNQCNNQLLLDKEQEEINQQNKLLNCSANCDQDCDRTCNQNCVEQNSNQTSELNSPKQSNSTDSSCSDETCKEASKVILNEFKISNE